MFMGQNWVFVKKEFRKRVYISGCHSLDVVLCGNGMNKLPLVSVVVPTYNDGDTIELCLRTLLRQTYPVKEIIVVDDGSTDNTTNILSRIAKEDPSLHIIPIKHGGRSKARNVGFKHSKGEIVLFGEGDAIYDKEYLTKAVELLTKNSEMGGVCLTGAPWIVKSTLVTECINVENTIKHKLLEKGKMQPYYAWVYRRKAIETAGAFDEGLIQAEDKDLFHRVKKAGYSIGLVMGINWHHRRDQDVWTYMKRNYAGGKTRILYVLKHHKVMEFFRSVALLWFLIVILPFVFFFPLLSYVVLFALFLPAMYKLFFTLRFGWNDVEKKRYLFLIPLFSALRYLATAVGYTHGLLLVFVKKLTKKPVNWT